MVDHTFEATVQFTGLGDADGDERTLSDEAAKHISDIAATDLRERYTDLNADTEIHVVAINAPNVAIITDDSDSGDS